MTETNTKIYPGIRQSVGIVLMIIMVSVVTIPLAIVSEGVVSSEVRLLIIYVLMFGIPLWIAWVIRKNTTGEKSLNLRIPNKHLIPYTSLGAVALSVGLITPLVLITLRLIPMSEGFQDFFSSLGNSRHWAVFITVVIAAPVLEELLFRGIMLDGLMKKYSASTAIFVSSFLFALIHFNPWQFVTAFILGLFIGWIYYHTRSTGLAIIIHFANNLFVTVFDWVYKADEFITGELSIREIYGGWGFFIFYTIGSLIILGLCITGISRIFSVLSLEKEKQANMRLIREDGPESETW